MGKSILKIKLKLGRNQINRKKTCFLEINLPSQKKMKSVIFLASSVLGTVIHRIDSEGIFKRLSDRDEEKLEHESSMYSDYKEVIVIIVTLTFMFIFPVILIQWLRLFNMVRDTFFKK